MTSKAQEAQTGAKRSGASSISQHMMEEIDRQALSEGGGS